MLTESHLSDSSKGSAIDVSRREVDDSCKSNLVARVHNELKVGDKNTT